MGPIENLPRSKSPGKVFSLPQRYNGSPALGDLVDPVNVWLQKPSKGRGLVSGPILRLRGTQYSIRTAGGLGPEVRRGNRLLGTYKSLTVAKLQAIAELAQALRAQTHPCPAPPALQAILIEFDTLCGGRYGTDPQDPSVGSLPGDLAHTRQFLQDFAREITPPSPGVSCGALFGVALRLREPLTFLL